LNSVKQSPLFRPIFVPQGAEFTAVQRGLNDLPSTDRPELIPIPAGFAPADRFFRAWVAPPLQSRHHKYPQNRSLADDCSPLLLGLCGSVSPSLLLGTAIAYRSIRHPTQSNSYYLLNPPDQLTHLAEIQTTPVDALNVDQAVCHGADKQAIARDFGVMAIDMESLALARQFPQATIVRVVSDDLAGDIPDLSQAFDDRGNLQPLALAAAFARQPIAAARLIRGSLLALERLTAVTRAIVTLL